MNEQELEEMVAEKHLTAPRLTPDEIDDVMVSRQFHVFPGTTTTVCCLLLENGYAVIGYSAPASAENFDEEIGRKLAFDDAREKIWRLEGYLLRENLHKAAMIQNSR